MFPILIAIFALASCTQSKAPEELFTAASEDPGSCFFLRADAGPQPCTNPSVLECAAKNDPNCRSEWDGDCIAFSYHHCAVRPPLECSDGFVSFNGLCFRAENCESLYVLSGEDLPVLVGCNQCKVGFGLNDERQCVACKPELNCSRCETQYGACDACPDGFGFDGKGGCLPCKPELNCLACSHSFEACRSCSAGYGISGASCISCQKPNCAECANANRCDKCLDGYRANKGTCLKCADANCKRCDNDSAQCQICNEGYANGGDSTKPCTKI